MCWRAGTTLGRPNVQIRTNDLHACGGGSTSVPMLIGAALIICLLSVPLAGGKLSALADIKFRDAWLLPSALGIQLLIVYAIPGWPGWVLDSLHVWTYAFAALFVYLNFKVPGVLVVALGGLSNFCAIAANGG